MPPSAICLYCGSSPGFEPIYDEAARRLGRAIAGAGHRLVYGGGSVGLMGAAADAALDAGGTVIGVITQQLVSLEVAHRGLTELDVQPTMHQRKARMAELADGVIVLPGGFGTWEEAIELLTWNQLGLAAAPVVFFDVGGFYRPLFDLMDDAVDAGFVSPSHRGCAQRATDADEAVRMATGPPPAWSPKPGVRPAGSDIRSPH
jgi:uncharacterized protein (TIGR00730 family)